MFGAFVYVAMDVFRSENNVPLLLFHLSLHVQDYYLLLLELLSVTVVEAYNWNAHENI